MAPSSPDLELPPIAATDNPALTGWRAPVRSESTSSGPFAVAGAIPRGLEGRLLWLGPNPVLVTDPAAYDPVEGDGMLFGLEIRDGRPLRQWSRLVVTRHLVDLLGSHPPEGPLGAAGPFANRALVHLSRRLLALDGLGLGYRITPELRTACVEDFDAMLASPMGTQVVVDPATGTATFLGIDPEGPPFLRLHRLDLLGTQLETSVIDVESFRAEPALGVTETNAVLAESSLIAPPLRGADDTLRPLAFDPDHAPRIGRLALDATSDIAWSTSEPGHVVSLLSAQDTILGVRAVGLRSSPVEVPDPSWWPRRGVGHLEALEVNDIGRSVVITRLDDLELSSLVGDAAAAQHERRHLYAATLARAGQDGALLVKYDLVTGHAERRAVDEHLVVDQPQFVRDPEGRTDEEGWVVVPAFDRSSATSVLVILDATRFSGRPEAIVTLPDRLPIGLQGLFVPPGSYR